jgi:RHS repeat-associated protein
MKNVRSAVMAVSLFFSISAFAGPNITSLTPSTGAASTSVIVAGSGFGSLQGASTITLNGVAATVTSWSDTSITATVPSGATSGNVVVNNGSQSNGLPFTVGPVAYSKARAIVIDHTKVSNTDQSNFPVLISGTYSYLATIANGGQVQNANGYDIIFTSDATGANKLDHEIESYDPVTGTVNFWVRIPLLSHSADTVIYMQYGSTAVVTSQENKTGVWDSNFETVWHLSGATLSAADSTIHGTTGKILGAVGAAGKIGGAASFAGSQLINMGNMGARPTQGTISMWINGAVPANAQNFFATGTIGTCGNVAIRFEVNGENIAAVTGDDSCGSNTTRVSLTNSFLSKQWHHVTATWDSSAGILTSYYDGKPAGAGSDSLWPSNFGHVQIGLGYDANRFWQGQVDEVRMSTVNRSPDWVATEYNNQSSPATFYAAGPENAPFLVSLAPFTGSPGTPVTIAGVGFGATAGTVTFNGQNATVTNWSDTSIAVVVPSGASSGPVIVSNGGVSSNGVPFAIFGSRRAIVIDKTKVPNTDQSNFPVLISGTYSYLANVANGGKVQSANGYDIIFTTDTAGANKLDHEIESYDPVTGTVNFWVRMPTLSHTADTIIYMQYGSGNVNASLENKFGVWSKGYAAVWHFSDNIASPGDSTVNGNAGTGHNANAAVGKIGGAVGFTSSVTSYVNFGHDPSLNVTNGVTVSAWVYPNSVGNLSGIFSKGSNPEAGDYLMRSNSGKWAAAVNNGSWTVAVSHNAPTIQSWSKLDMCWDGSQVRQYTNGVLDTTTPLSGSITPNIKDAYVGYNPIDDWVWDGAIDEVRVRTDGCRSADWIATEYNNQNAPATFYSVGSENAAAIVFSLTPSAAVPESSVTISGQGFGATAGTVTFNGQAATVTNWSDTSIVVLVPDGASSGPVVVTNGTGTSNSALFTVLQPVITALTPASAEPTNSVTITGSNFGANQGTVSFNGQPATITNWTDTSIVVAVPASATSGNVVVSSRGLQSAGAPFTVLLPVISSLSPNAGDPGTSVVIAGSGFGPAQGSVTFSGTLAVVTYWNDRSITAQVPNGAGGGNVVVTSAVGRSSNGAGFNVTDNLAITLISPTTGPVGTQVTITGGGFGAAQGSSVVQFNGITAAVNNWTDTQITVTVPAGTVTAPISVIVGGNTVESVSPFAVSLQTQVTDSRGNTSTYTSTMLGGDWKNSASTGSGCSSCTVRGTLSKTLDAVGNVLSQADELGHVTSYAYDGNSNVTSQSVQLDANTAVTTMYTYNSFGEPLTVTDPLGNTTTNTYDAKGNLLTVTSPAPNTSTPASVTQFAYDNRGELTQVTDPLGHVTQLTYNAVGLIATITDAQQNVTAYQYDAHGNRTAVIDALQHQTGFAYDAGDRLTKITYPDQTAVSFAYDSRGRRTSVTDQNGQVTSYVYDDADRLVSVKNAANNVTQYAYDTENNLLSITDANGHTTLFTYDAFGRVTQTTFPSALAESYSYDAAGNLTNKTDRNGNSILYVYDALNRLTHKGYPDSTGVDYVYDLAGKIKQVSDPTGSYGFAYDNLGRLIGTTTQYSFLPGTTFRNAYGYDAGSNKTLFTAPDGSVNTYQYDALNRLTSLNNSLTGQFGFGYDALSRRTALTRPNGVNTNYNYDSLSRLLSVLHQAGATTLDGASYSYDNAGNRTTKTNLLSNVTEQYNYDPIYQLTQVTQGAATTESYSYDAVGNRMSSLGTSTYNYNASNRLTAIPTATFAYESNGNTLSKTDSTGTRNYTWDFENRLTSAVLPGSAGTVTFKYDPLGRRIQKSSANGTTIYLYDGANSVAEVDQTGSLQVRYTQGTDIDEPLAEQRNGSAAYYQQDGLGSVTSLTSGTGALANSYTYDAFGNLNASTGTLANPFQYTGRDNDQETGLRYYRARYYDPKIGRFISEDPEGFAADVNFYAYVGNDPIDYTDPWGLVRRCITKIILVTAYSDRGQGSDRRFPYSKSGHGPRDVGPGTVAVAQATTRFPDQPYPFGADVTVSGPLRDPVFDPTPLDPFNTPAYVGVVHDTGLGFDANHHHVQPDDWIDIWLPTRKAANKWGVRWRKVTICYEDGCKQ